MQTSRVNNSRIIKFKNTNFSGYCFQMKSSRRVHIEIFISAIVYLLDGLDWKYICESNL